MIVDQLSLFPKLSGETVVLKSAKEPQKPKPRKKKDDGGWQDELWDRDSSEMKMLKETRRAHAAWLKKSLLEYPHLEEKIKKLERIAAGEVEKDDFSRPTATKDEHNPKTQKPRYCKNDLTDEERHLAELIRAAEPGAFHKKSIGLMTRGRFHQQVKTLVQKEPELQLLVEQIIDFSREETLTHSPVEKSVLRHEGTRERALRLAAQLRQKKAIFDEALGQLKKYQPEYYEMLRMKFILRYKAIKVQMELEFESESTYAAHLRDALDWLGKYVQDARTKLG